MEAEGSADVEELLNGPLLQLLRTLNVPPLLRLLPVDKLKVVEETPNGL